MKKFLTLLLASTLLLSGCSTKDKTKGSDVTKSPTETKQIDVMMWYRDAADFQNMQYYKDIEAKTGICSNFTLVSGSDWTTKLNLMFASQKYPDVILRGGVDTEMYGVDQKILRPLDEDIDKYMPTYKKILNYEPGMADKMRASNGKMYYLGWLVPQNINVNGHLFVNKRWLDNLGLKAPTTVKEFEDMLTAFRDKDPNKNGKKDEIPFTGTRTGNIEGYLSLLSFWGIPYNTNWVAINDDDRVYSHLQDKNMRDAMVTLNRWYKEGLLDKEAIAQDTTAFDAKINVASAGSFWRWRLLAMNTDKSIYEQYQAILPVAAEGRKPKVNQYLELPGFGAALTAGTKDVKAALTWLDAQYEFENQMNGYYGKYKEVTKDNKPTQYGWRNNSEGKVEFFNADLNDCPNQSALHFFSGKEYFSKVSMPPQRIEKTEYSKKYTDAGVVEKYSASILTSLAKLTPKETEQKNLLAAEIQKYSEEAIVGFVTKGVTDENWNTYLKTLDNLKINDYTKIYQDAYNRYKTSIK
jgi:putative aldouronate transport system substrate-binding protein